MVESELGYNMTTMDPGDWHLNKKLSGGGSLQNLGVYCVQAARYILGEGLCSHCLLDLIQSQNSRIKSQCTGPWSLPVGP